MLIDPQSRRRFLETPEEVMDCPLLDRAIQSLLDAGWQIEDDLDVIKHEGVQRLVLRICGLKPLFDAVALGHINRPVVQIVAELIEQFRHNIPEGGSELDRLSASVPPDESAEVEFLLEKVDIGAGDRMVDAWSLRLL